MQHSQHDTKRLEIIDFARGIALVAMAVYHFTWDLEFFGYTPQGMAATGGWRLFARSIASSFLFLVGLSLVLAHARGIKWRSFSKRLAIVIAAAAAITIATWIAMPEGFIFFGILHHIALASLLGLAFLRLPVWIMILVAIFIISAPHYLRSPVFDHPALWWVGLSSSNPYSVDYVPLFPWFGSVLLGIATARIAQTRNLFSRLRPLTMPRWSCTFQLFGRHSLTFYLIHQPVLIGMIWLFSFIIPPGTQSREAEFSGACTALCQQTENQEFCSTYCGCVLDRLQAENRFDEVFEQRPTSQTSQRLQEIVGLCSAAPVPSDIQKEQ